MASEIKDIDEIRVVLYLVGVVARVPYIKFLERFALLALLSGAAATVGGGEDGEIDNAEPTCAEDTRGDSFVVGISKTGDAEYTVAIVDSMPAPPDPIRATIGGVWRFEIAPARKSQE
ncbi:MAG: hypothetical protein GY811_18825 [Myxococcales bacterium]|nr:hypothetical protein [Myxococcales bacterium]